METSLSEEIAELHRNTLSKVPSERINTFMIFISSLVEKKVGELAPKVGDRFPEFELFDTSTELFRASEEWSGKNLVIKFYRGGWCPFCNLELKALERIREGLSQENSILVAVAPEKPEHLSRTRAQAGSDFRYIWDSGGKLAKALKLSFDVDGEIKRTYLEMGLDLQHVNGEWELPVTATFVVRNGVVIYRYLDQRYNTRQEPSELLRHIKNLNECMGH